MSNAMASNSIQMVNTANALQAAAQNVSAPDSQVVNATTNAMANAANVSANASVRVNNAVATANVATSVALNIKQNASVASAVTSVVNAVANMNGAREVKNAAAVQAQNIVKNTTTAAGNVAVVQTNGNMQNAMNGNTSVNKTKLGMNKTKVAMTGNEAAATVANAAVNAAIELQNNEAKKVGKAMASLNKTVTQNKKKLHPSNPVKKLFSHIQKLNKQNMSKMVYTAEGKMKPITVNPNGNKVINVNGEKRVFVHGNKRHPLKKHNKATKPTGKHWYKQGMETNEYKNNQGKYTVMNGSSGNMKNYLFKGSKGLYSGSML